MDKKVFSFRSAFIIFSLVWPLIVGQPSSIMAIRRNLGRREPKNFGAAPTMVRILRSTTDPLASSFNDDFGQANPEDPDTKDQFDSLEIGRANQEIVGKRGELLLRALQPLSGQGSKTGCPCGNNNQYGLGSFDYPIQGFEPQGEVLIRSNDPSILQSLKRDGVFFRTSKRGYITQL